jgi:hypothetical protein
MLLLISCSSTEKSTERDRTDRIASGGTPYLDVPDEAADEFLMEDMNELERLLYDTRNTLDDESVNLQHEMPEMFTRIIESRTNQVDEFVGFRVQILSTRDVVHADTTRDGFMAWADSTLAGYEPNAYVFFRQPYYRVRTGDFRDRDMAIEFSRILKQYYPDAWVVHDRIEPNRVPADTASIRIREPEDILQQMGIERVDSTRTN